MPAPAALRSSEKEDRVKVKKGAERDYFRTFYYINSPGTPLLIKLIGPELFLQVRY